MWSPVVTLPEHLVVTRDLLKILENSNVPQICIDDAFRQQLLDMGDTLVAGSLELFQCQAGRLVRLMELLRSHARVPARLESGQLTADLFEAHAVRALVGAGVGGEF